MGAKKEEEDRKVTEKKEGEERRRSQIVLRGVGVRTHKPTPSCTGRTTRSLYGFKNDGLAVRGKGRIEEEEKLLDHVDCFPSSRSGPIDSKRVCSTLKSRRVRLHAGTLLSMRIGSNGSVSTVYPKKSNRNKRDRFARFEFPENKAEKRHTPQSGKGDIVVRSGWRFQWGVTTLFCFRV
uniref:Uncharacterized protein n=1 Tax=Vespula pensylvanica TaxID=30213 RepID=A0A834KRP8_VESPE|nr:hypothetical protein H0235_013258 [Vespula pensylvanica]